MLVSMYAMPGRTCSLASSWDERVRGWEDRCGDTVDCHLERSKCGLRGHIRTLRYACKVSKDTPTCERGQRTTHPLQLIRLLLLGHLLTNAVGVPESPYGQLVQDSQFLKDIEIQKSQRLFIIPEGVRNVRGFGVVLSLCVFVKVLKSGLRCQSTLTR